MVPARPGDRILLSRTSPLGIFFRRAQLEFARLHFHDASKLWIGLLGFRAPTEVAWKRRNLTAVTSNVFDAAIAEFDVQQPSKLTVACYRTSKANELDATDASLEVVERLLEFDVDRVQRGHGPVQKLNMMLIVLRFWHSGVTTNEKSNQECCTQLSKRPYFGILCKVRHLNSN